MFTDSMAIDRHARISTKHVEVHRSGRFWENCRFQKCHGFLSNSQLPYFKNLAVAGTFLEDLRSIALNKCSSQEHSVRNNLYKSFEINLDVSCGS